METPCVVSPPMKRAGNIFCAAEGIGAEAMRPTAIVAMRVVSEAMRFDWESRAAQGRREGRDMARPPLEPMRGPMLRDRGTPYPTGSGESMLT